MPEWLFPDSLQNADTYTKAKRYWESLWQSVLQDCGQEKLWQTPWMNNPNADGNPIFTAVSEQLGKGVRIIEEDPQDPDDIDFDWWLDYAGDNDSPDAIRELVIACCPSRENQAEVQRLLMEWIQNGELTSKFSPAEWSSAKNASFDAQELPKQQ